MQKEKYLFVYIILKLIFTILSVSCTIPYGIFTPSFTLGIVCGQLYCQTLIRILSWFDIKNVIKSRSLYSIIGASALTSSVTRTVSVSLIILELNGHLSHAVPVMISSLTAYIISETVNPQGFYEMLQQLNGLNDKLASKAKILIK